MDRQASGSGWANSIAVVLTLRNGNVFYPYGEGRKVAPCHTTFLVRSLLCCSLIICGSMVGGTNLSVAQVLGEKAEMDRLEEKAENDMANGDPNGAALNIGKAALMASLLAEKETDAQAKQVYDGVQALFRAQENGYRALALFEQAGGQLPPPSGVCQLLGLAQQNGNIATKKLAEVSIATATMSENLHARFNMKTKEWLQIIEELQTDFSCS